MDVKGMGLSSLSKRTHMPTMGVERSTTVLTLTSVGMDIWPARRVECAVDEGWNTGSPLKCPPDLCGDSREDSVPGES